MASLYVLLRTSLEMMGLDSHILPISLCKGVQLSLFQMIGNFPSKQRTSHSIWKAFIKYLLCIKYCVLVQPASHGLFNFSSLKHPQTMGQLGS